MSSWVRGSSLVALLWSGTAAAQSADQAANEIIVTATRRSERLQDVPISVTAFSQEKLDQQGLRGIDDLSRFSPGVTFTRTGLAGNYNDQSNTIAIRGIDSSAGAATTGIYIDDTPIQSRRIGFGSQNAYPALFDVERVEVLRGPQGTLFGAGSEGGTVRFIAPLPSLAERDGYGRAEIASTAKGGVSYELGAAVGGPLVTDRLGIRIGASFRHDGGYVDRVDYRTGDITERPANYTDTETFRIALKWRATDALTISPSLYYQSQYTNDTGAYWAQNPALSDRKAGVFQNGNALRNTNRDPFYLAALRADYDFGGMSLISNTSYFSRRNRAASDYTQFDRAVYLYFLPLPPEQIYLPPAGAAGVAAFTDFQKNFYQEVRLQSTDAKARFAWTIGAFYSHLDEDSTEFITDAMLDAQTAAAYGDGSSACSTFACPNGLIYAQPRYRVIDRQIAGFGEASVKITPQLTATAGVRIARVEYSSDATTGGAFVGSDLAGVTNREASAETPVTPKVSIAFKPDRDTLLYATAAKGYRVGGTNLPVATSCDADLAAIGIAPGTDGVRRVNRTYKSDSVWSYEAGAKIALFDRRVIVNGSVFLIDWKNIQQNVYLPTCGLQYTDNLGKVRSVGGDLEIAARPSDALTLGLTVAYNDAYYTGNAPDITGFAPVVSRGDRLRGAPWSIVASAEYRVGDDKDNQPYVRADYQYSAKLTKLTPELNTGNSLSDPQRANIPTVQNLNLRAGLRLRALDISLFVQNLTNDLPVLVRNRDIAADGAIIFERSARPRTVGLTITYRR